MKMKKYTAATMPEAMIQIRRELGKDAVILRTKELTSGGIFGLFKKKRIEVIAALDPDVTNGSHTVQKTVISRAAPLPKAEKVSADKDLSAEIAALKQEVKSAISNQTRHYALPLQGLYDRLLHNEVHPQIASELMEHLLGNDSDEDAEQVLYENLVKRFEKVQTPVQFEKKFIHLVGPTGVGKTTTIAKLAAKSALVDQKRVAFITTDTYRIAAIDQLRTYAKILEVPLEVAYSLEDYKAAREKLADYDLVFVDTAGRNFKDSAYVKELEHTLDLHHEAESYLALSLTTRAGDLSEVYEQFAHLPIKQFIFTKMDEASCYGGILNLIQQAHIGVAYLTHGQDVPDDILVPSASYLAKSVMEATARV
ncbi:flagellar biosynthesis protein FlhF [Terribacillus halophilus]|uniref:Flagellar biosynthesis protein FlhF n=1 Tax=Terribacillus halophilus TaxID=361279 RepID=A0A1G6N438_9BACI|nr:flagellar biosynthesis protein FlhF [Terribacillus halophilus]SDC62602.1 flagellar biosynthesis protein FlhF [Terribacillus halophilus]